MFHINPYDADAKLQEAVYESIQEALEEGISINDQSQIEQQLRNLTTLLESTFWMIVRSQRDDSDAA